MSIKTFFFKSLFMVPDAFIGLVSSIIYGYKTARKNGSLIKKNFQNLNVGFEEPFMSETSDITKYLKEKGYFPTDNDVNLVTLMSGSKVRELRNSSEVIKNTISDKVTKSFIGQTNFYYNTLNYNGIYVIITTGDLLQVLGTREDILSMIAHELGHVITLSNDDMLNTQKSPISDACKSEYKADKKGLEIMKNVFMIENPSKCFKKMLIKTALLGGFFSNLFSDVCLDDGHPGLLKRIKNLEEVD